jgi:hypothetical protein
MASKFADFIKQNKIDSRRILAISSKLEHLRPDDRAIKLKKRNSKGKEAAAAPKEGEGEAAAPKKPRSGRRVTARLLATATAGKTVSGPQKTRILRAVNHILEQKKKPAVELKALF